MKPAAHNPLTLPSKGLEPQSLDKRMILALALAENPDLVQDMRQPGATWLWGETTNDTELYVALKGYRDALNAFVKGQYSKLSEEAQWLARIAVVPYQLGYYWVLYDIRVRQFLWPYCESWAVEAVQSETSIEGSLVRAVEADLRLCMQLETVGDRVNGYQRFGEIFLQRFTDTTTRLLMQPDADCTSIRQEGRDLCGNLADFELWLRDPTRYLHLMPSGSDPLSSMLRESQFLVQQRYKKQPDIKWVSSWIRAWRAHFRKYALGTKIRLVQLDGGELVQPFRGNFKPFKPRVQRQNKGFSD